MHSRLEKTVYELMTRRSGGGTIKLLSDFKKEPQVMLEIGKLGEDGVSYDYRIVISMFHFLLQGAYGLDDLCEQFNTIGEVDEWGIYQDEHPALYGLGPDHIKWLEENNFKYYRRDDVNPFNVEGNLVSVVVERDGKYYHLVKVRNRESDNLFSGRAEGVSFVKMFTRTRIVDEFGKVRGSVDGCNVYAGGFQEGLIYDGTIDTESRYFKENNNLDDLLSFLEDAYDAVITKDSDYELYLDV